MNELLDDTPCLRSKSGGLLEPLAGQCRVHAHEGGRSQKNLESPCELLLVKHNSPFLGSTTGHTDYILFVYSGQ